jgi:hypothetical protein
MNLKYYREVSRTKCIEENYFWYFPNGYVCVDARYVGIHYNRSFALRELESFFYKLIYLNDGVSMGVLVDAGIKLLNEAKTYKGVYISEYDIHYMVDKCFKEEFSNDMMEMIYDNKKIMWKADLSDLYVMNEQELKTYESLNGFKKEKYYREFKSKKKQIEALNFLNKQRSMNKRDLVIEAIKVINEEKKGNDFCSITDVVNKTKISFNVVKKHYEWYIEKTVKVKGYNLMVNKNEICKEEKINEIQSVINQMKLNNEKINKNSVSEKSGASRTTVTKHWDNLNK